MRLLLDQLYSNRIAEALRFRAHDALSAADVEVVRDRSDVVVFAWASQEGRALVTENVKDFVPISAACLFGGDHHSGLILTSPYSMSRARDPVGEFVRALDALLKAHQADDALRDIIHWLQPVD